MYKQKTTMSQSDASKLEQLVNKAERIGVIGSPSSTGELGLDILASELLSPYRDQLFYLGHVYGSRSMLPLWFKHFD